MFFLGAAHLSIQQIRSCWNLSKKLHVFHGSQNVIYKGMFFIGEFHESQGRDRKKSRMARGMPNRYREGSSLLAPSPTEGYVLSRI